MLPFLNIGPFAIPSKPFVIIIAIYTSLWLIENTIKELDVDAEWFRSISMNSVIVGVIGGRLVFALTHWEATLANPLAIIWPITVGYTLWGTILSGFVYLFWSAAKKQINLAKLLDLIIPSLLVLIGGWIIGDFLGGPGFGTPANLSLFKRHPVQLYELIVISFSLIIWRQARPQKTFNGWLFLVTSAVLSAGLLLTFRFRGGSLTILGGWQLNQIVVFLSMLISLGGLAFQTATGSQESLTSD